MNKKLGILLTIGIIVIGVFIGKLLSNQQEPMKKMPSSPSVSNYKFQTITNKIENFDIQLSGTLNSFNAVELYAEVTGVAQTKKVEFREGATFKKGDILLKIDDSVYKNSVYAQKSSFLNVLTQLIPDLKYDFPENAAKWETYLNSFEIDKSLKPLPTVTNEKEKYYLAANNIYNQYYTIKSQEATLAKYTIIAPFDGVITEANIKPGTLVRTSQSIGTFQNTSYFEMTAYASIDEVQMLSLGMPVTLFSDDIDGTYKGKISRINQTIYKDIQKVKVYISVKNNKLLDGTYFHAKINVNTKTPVTKIPQEAIFNAGSVWTDTEGKFKAQNIHIIKNNEKFALAKGLMDGQIILVNPDKNVIENGVIAKKTGKSQNSKNNK